MVLNLWFNLLIKKIFCNKNIFFIREQQILFSIVISVAVSNCYSSEDITKEADLEQQVEINDKFHLSKMVSTNNLSYQTFFQVKNRNNPSINVWRGFIIALFVDDNGNLREDSNANLKLDSTDAVINFVYHTETDEIKITRSIIGYSGNYNNAEDFYKLKPLWSTEQLAPQTITNLGSRKYKSINVSARYLYTQIMGSENKAKTQLLLKNICNNNYNYFNLKLDDCNKLINYLYGKVHNQQRSKTIISTDGKKKIINLGDIVNSDLIEVGTPQENYSASYNDLTYAEFQKHYINRRKMLYVGANDGFIHAFNAGFYNPTATEIQLSGDNKELKHPLGAEIWAYAPMNLLPHLNNLTNPDYKHQFFMNGGMQAVDARIFPNDTHHPHGWGTLLLANMGLGGKNVSLKINYQSKSFKSSYILLDITNPEIEPPVIAEINHEQLGFTLGKPVIVKRKIADSSKDSITHNWYLIFASGPANNNDQTKTTDSLKIFIYDLQNKKFITGFNPKITNFGYTYAGNMQNVDWWRNYEDSCVYFGTLEHTAGVLRSGSLLRLQLISPIENSILSTVITNLPPIVQAPLLVKDKKNLWLFFGSGRLLTTSDYLNTQEQSVYGVCEQIDQSGNFSTRSIDENNLIETNNIGISTTGDIKSVVNGNLTSLIVNKNTITNFSQLENVIAKQGGWKFKFSASKPQGVLQQQPQRIASLILFSEFKPKSKNIFVGDRYLHILHYTTGTASTRYKVFSGNGYSPNQDKNILIKIIDLGIGYKTDAYITKFDPSKKIMDILIPNGGKISISSSNIVDKNKVYQDTRLSWRKIK